MSIIKLIWEKIENILCIFNFFRKRKELRFIKAYLEAKIEYMRHLKACTETIDSKFKDFKSVECKIGDTVSFNLPPKYEGK
jgi:hypothetical protein